MSAAAGLALLGALLAGPGSKAQTGGEPPMLAPQVGSKQLLSDVTRPPDVPSLPPELAKRAQYWGLYRVCVDSAGAVSHVSVLRSALDPAAGLTPETQKAADGLDARWIETMKKWRYRPHVVEGKPGAFCYAHRVQLGPAAPPPAVMVAPTVGAGQLLSDYTKPPHKPTLTPGLAKPGESYWGLYKICVAVTGEVAKVNVIKSAHDDQLDARWMDVIKSWRYRPYRVGGREAPFCYTLRLQVAAT
jgi:outer membrane biosynthesis protein TonB